MAAPLHDKPLKTLPPDYQLSGGVSIRVSKDLLPMLVWSIVLPVFTFLLAFLILFLFRDSGSLTLATGANVLSTLAGILLVTVIMLIVHEGLHGLVFWLITHEVPRFEFKWYYASASPGDWYLPRTPFLIATLLPLVGITLLGFILLPVVNPYVRFLLLLFVIFNASGAAGDWLVAWRLLCLPEGTYARDSGSEVTFYSPLTGRN